MSTTGSHGGQAQSAREYRAEPTSAGPAATTRRNPWMWVSVVLAVALVGLVIWQLSTQSDLDDAQQQVKAQQAQIDTAKASGNDAAATYKTAYQELEQELGATQQDLSQTQQELKGAEQSATHAQQDADAAKQQIDQATSAQEKATAETEQAKAEAEAAKAQSTVTKDCANAFLAQVSAVVQSEDPNAAAATAKQELQGIAQDCKAALSGG